MKKNLLNIALSVLSISCFSQDFAISRGPEIKLKKGTSNTAIVDWDNSGVYFLEGQAKTNRLSIKEPYSTIYKLYKFDQAYSLLFEKDYEKDLKEMELNSFQTLNGGLFMFVTDYNKKELAYTISSAKINRNTGDLDPGFAEISKYRLDKNDDMRKVTITPAENGKSLLMVTRIVTDTRQIMGINILDSSLRKKHSLVINFSFGAVKEVADEALYVNGKIILLVRRLEIGQTGKEKKYQLKNYLLMVYDLAGVKEKEFVVNTEGKSLREERLFALPDGKIMLAGFYTVKPEKSVINGFFTQQFNIKTSQVEKQSEKEITPTTFLKQTKGNEKEFPDNFTIRSIDINPVDQSVIITAELSIFSWGGPRDSEARFENQHILVINVATSGEIKWMKLIPKSQNETALLGEGILYSGYLDYIARGGGMPYYSSFTHLIKNNSLILILNDDANCANRNYGDKLEAVYNFKKTSLYGISIDLSTGKMNAKIITSNNNDEILAPRHSFIIGNEILMPSWREHSAAKTELRLVKITVD